MPAVAATSARAPAPPRAAPATLRVGGMVPLTTTDYPGELAAAVFCQGCPWRCSYCHNRHLIPARGNAEMSWDAVLSFLERRRGLLDAVVFSGGEPTLQAGIADAVCAVRALGFKVGLHTAGMYPRRLARLLPLLDWVALDVKAPFESYAEITGVAGSGAAVRESLALLLAGGVDYECRTTVEPGLLGPAAVERLADTLAGLGVAHYALQECRGSDAARHAPRPSSLDPAFCRGISRRFTRFSVRRATAQSAGTDPR